MEKKVAQDFVKKRRPRWRLGNKELSQLWKWSDANPNALTDPQRVLTPSILEYWKPLADDVYCWKGLRFSARQDLEGFSSFPEYGIEGVVPPELRKLDRSIRAKQAIDPSMLRRMKPREPIQEKSSRLQHLLAREMKVAGMILKWHPHQWTWKA